MLKWEKNPIEWLKGGLVNLNKMVKIRQYGREDCNMKYKMSTS